MKIALLLFTLSFSIVSFGKITSDIEQPATNSNNLFLQELNNQDITDQTRVKKITTYVAQNRYNSSTKQLIDEAVKIAFKSKVSISKAESYIALGNYYYYNSKLDSAETVLREAERFIEKENYPITKAGIFNSLSGIYRKQGNMVLAIETILKSKTILENASKEQMPEKKRQRLTGEQIILHNTLANFYNQIGDSKKAIENYDEAYKKALVLKSKGFAGVILSNKGDLLLNIGRPEDALLVLYEAKELKTEGKASEISIANTDQNIGLALLKTGNYNDALKNINRALLVFETKKVMSGLMESYTIRGNIYLELKQYNKAIQDCEKAKELSIKNGVLENQKNACLCLSKAYENISDYKNANKNFKLYTQAKDSIFNEKNIKKTTQLEMQYEYNKEKELQELITKNREKEHRTTVNLLIIGLLLFLLISGLLYTLNHSRRKLNKQLEEKNKLLSDALAINETLLKETHHRVKNNLQIISSLLNMQSNFLEDSHTKDIVIESQNRIKSMSLIHQKLYQGSNLTSIESSTYFNDLLDSLLLSYGIDREVVKTDIVVENILLDVDTAIPLGLILTELISNAFKYGVDKKSGEFYFSFTKGDSKQLLVTIRDNGPGMPEDFDIHKTKSYGMKLVDILSKKLKAELKFNNKNGLEIIMKINRFKIVA